GESIPMFVQAAEHLVLSQVQVWLLKRRLAASLHLAQVVLELFVALDKGQRLLLEWQRVVSRLETCAIEFVQGPNIVHPAPHPILKFQPTARHSYKIPDSPGFSGKITT